jgi:AbiU2
MNPQIEIVRLTVEINADLSQAIAYYELFAPSGLSAPLIKRVNQHLIHEGFNVVSEALELDVITTLCRIWDKTRGTARITEVVSRLRRNPSVVSDQTAFAQWQADVEAFEKSEHLTALRGFRNVGLAHRSDPRVGLAGRLPRLGDVAPDHPRPSATLPI